MIKLICAWLALLTALYGLFGYVAKRQSGVCFPGFSGCGQARMYVATCVDERIEAAKAPICVDEATK